MAATKPGKNSALAALTTAALSLPGLNAQAAVPVTGIKTTVSYGHYQESNQRMQVDVYHADAIIPLSERLEFAFSIDRDTYSGATPTFSMPESLTNLPKYKHKADGTPSKELSYVDLVSAASAGVNAGELTQLGGLNAFASFSDGSEANKPALDAAALAASAAFDAAKTIDIATSTDQYLSQLDIINPAIRPLMSQFEIDKAAINTDLPVINGELTLDFNPGMSFSAYSGFANNAPVAGGNCSGTGSSGCFYDAGLVVGIVQDTSDPIAHLHRGGTAGNRSLLYHGDSSGIYIRAQDSKPFSLVSMNFNSLPNDENPDANGTYTSADTGLEVTGVAGPNDFWEILGYGSALNPGLDTAVNNGPFIARQTVTNGFNGLVTLNSGFQNISAFWIHYAGYQQSPKDGKSFQLELDNITVNAAAYDDRLRQLTADYNTNLAALTASDPDGYATLTANYEAQKTALTNDYAAQKQAAEAQLFKQSTVALYRAILDSLVPNGTPTVQRFQIQPQETRTMPQFTAKYYFDATTLAASGGMSDEPDFLSNFGSTNISHEFNDKLTTVSAGYGLTSNTITRNGGHSGHSEHSTHYASPEYAELNEQSTFHSFNVGLAQVLSKNTLFQSTASFTRQSGYLSNPYKYVYVRGEVTPEEYYNIWQNMSDTLNWSSITNLEMVGTELFREKRPNQRNIFSISNGLNQHIPALNASVHFDYRYYADDWGIDSHTLELKWFQSLPWGLTVTPGIRYYSQTQADFFAPYFLAPRADGNYSSDFRLSAFGDLSGGLTVSKEFARGIKLEIGAEYVTHAGSLKLGGDGVGDYADFNYYLAHANLNVDLGARAFSGGEHAGHQMHHHGAPVPAGVMFGHMMNQADAIMVGYRYQYSGQSGDMLHGSAAVSDQDLVANACDGFSNGCLLKPAKMHMHMHMLDLMYAPTDWLNVMLMPQLMSMDMTMSDTLRTLSADETTANLGDHGGAKHVSNDLGDTVVTALVKVLDTDGHHVHLSLGASAPTGSIDAELSGTQLTNTGSTQVNQSTITLQDYGMQTGSGTWDFKPSLTYTGQFNDWSWGAQISGVKRLERNKYGYAYGDIFQTTSWGSYQVFNWLSASVRGVYTAQDRIRGESSQTHQTTATVDYPSNYGGRFADVGFGLNAMLPGGQFAGHNLSFEWLQPVSTDYNGYQLDRSGSLAVSWNYAF